MDIQAMLTAASAQWQRGRAETQMTLGKLIAALEAMPKDAMVAGLHDPHSYRGYYEDLAFRPGDESRRASDLLADCKSVMGRELTGYKGGEFMMGENTPVWVAHYGCCGVKLIALQKGGGFETANDDD